MSHSSRLTLVLFLICTLSCAAAITSAQSQKELNAAGSSEDAWLLTNKDYAGHRYANLQQINKDNVSKLKPACTYESGVAAPSQTSPLIYKGVMYLTVGYLTAAIDASNCKEMWRYICGQHWRVRMIFPTYVAGGHRKRIC